MESSKFLKLALSSTISVAVLNFFAVKYNYYWIFPWFDILVHFLGGFAIANLVFAFFVKGIKSKTISIKKASIGVMFATLIVALGWEAFEFKTGITFISKNYIPDTVLDILVALLGSLVVVLNEKNIFLNNE